MPADPPVVEDRGLQDLVPRIIAEVLVVPAEQVQPGSRLIAELGAESIDFLDLVFRIEEALGKRIPITRWQRYLERRFGNGDLSEVITTEVVRQFAEEEAA